MAKNETTIGISFSLRNELQEDKLIPEETYEGVIRRYKKENVELKKRVEELERKLA